MPRSEWRKPLALLAVVPAVAFGQVAPASPPAVVNGVLFYSPTCPHCHQVMTVDLPPLLQRYGTQLRIVGVNTLTTDGQSLYRATVERLRIPTARLGVPTLVVGARVLVGSQEIPDELPGIVDRGLAAGGVGWPDVPEIRQAVVQAETAARREAARQQIVAGDTPRVAGDSASRPAAGAARPEAPATIPAPAAAAARADTSASGARVTDAAPSRPSAAAPAPRAPAVTPPAQRPPAPPALRVPDTTPPPGRGATTDTGAPVAAPIALTETATPSAWERFEVDPVGNGAAVAVLVAMVLALGLVALSLLGRRVPVPVVPSWVVPVLGLIGLGVASYLAVVEVTGARAVCGPVGDCNTVQQSEYARLFGVLPIGVLGMAGYVGMIGLWLLGVLGQGGAARAGRLGAWSLALIATAFSVYLTFLEPFVIGAACAWCLSSAVIATLLLLVLTQAVRQDLSTLGFHSGPTGG